MIIASNSKIARELDSVSSTNRKKAVHIPLEGISTKVCVEGVDYTAFSLLTLMFYCNGFGLFGGIIDPSFE
jgi:hypothetical protein